MATPHTTTAHAGSSRSAAALMPMVLPPQSAEQLPVRTMSRLDVAALLYGTQDSLHAAWECYCAERPVHWIEPGWAVQQ